MRTQVQFLAQLSWLRIQHCCELHCRTQMQLGSGVTVAVVEAGGYSTNLTISLGNSICCTYGPKKTTKKKKKKDKLTLILKNKTNKQKK